MRLPSQGSCRRTAAEGWSVHWLLRLRGHPSAPSGHLPSSGRQNAAPLAGELPPHGG